MGNIPRSGFDDVELQNVDVKGVLKVGGVQITASAAEINKLDNLAASTAEIDRAVDEIMVFRKTLTVAQVNAGTTAVVPGVAGKSFVVLDVRMRSTGNAAGATLVRVVEETSAAVVLSHVVADLTDGTWNGYVGGTPAETVKTAGGLIVAGKALLVDKTGDALSGTTAFDVVVVGYYTTA
jgi:L-ascorbate metabolism protein UlaG (beta-lactamase superfamily)